MAEQARAKAILMEGRTVMLVNGITQAVTVNDAIAAMLAYAEKATPPAMAAQGRENLAQAMMNAERAEHDLPFFDFDRFTRGEQRRYLKRADAVLSALTGDQ